MKTKPDLGGWRPLTIMLLTQLIWASNNIVAKIILLEASPVLVALVRFTLAGLLFHLPVFLLLHRGEQRFARQDWIRMAYLGAVCVVGSLVLHLIGLRTTPVTNAAIYTLMTPLFVLALAWFLYGERLGPSRLFGMALACLGALVLVTGGAFGLGGDPLGAALIITSSLIWSTYTLLSKEVLARRSPLLVLSAANLVAMVAVWPLAGVMGVWAELPGVLSWSATAWLVMLYLILLMSTTSQWMYIRSLRDLRTSQASALMYTNPFFAALMAAVVLAELPTLLTFLAGGLLMTGIWLVNRRAGGIAAEHDRPPPPAARLLARVTGLLPQRSVG